MRPLPYQTQETVLPHDRSELGCEMARLFSLERNENRASLKFRRNHSLGDFAFTGMSEKKRRHKFQFSKAIQTHRELVNRPCSFRNAVSFSSETPNGQELHAATSVL